MSKARSKTGTKDKDTHGVINPDEARAHVEAMENLMMKIEAEVKESAAPGLLDTILGDLKQALSNLIPQMQLADTVTMAQAIRDKNFNTLLPKTDEIDKILEEKLSSEDIPEATKVLKITQREGKMSEQDQELVAELFSNLEVAHEHAAIACSLLSRFIKNLKTGATDNDHTSEHQATSPADHTSSPRNLMRDQRPPGVTRG